MLGDCLISSRLPGFKFKLPASTGISFVQEGNKAYLVFFRVVWLSSFALALAITPACRSLSLCSSFIRSSRYFYRSSP